MFHIRLKELREQNNLTQQKLADILNISRSSLSSYETGAREPDFNILKDIASYFNVTIDYLLNYNTCNEKTENQEIHNEIDLLNDKSKEELKRYVELLKRSEIYESGKKNTNICEDRKTASK